MMSMRKASMQRKTILKSFMVVACVFALAGCTTVKGWFGGKDDDKLTDPAKLVEFTPTATVNKLWSAGVGKGEGRIGIHQGHTLPMAGSMRRRSAVASAHSTCTPARPNGISIRNPRRISQSFGCRVDRVLAKAWLS